MRAISVPQDDPEDQSRLDELRRQGYPLGEQSMNPAFPVNKEYQRHSPNGVIDGPMEIAGESPKPQRHEVELQSAPIRGARIPMRSQISQPDFRLSMPSMSGSGPAPEAPTLAMGGPSSELAPLGLPSATPLSDGSAAAAQRPVIAKPHLGPRAINVPPVQDELSRSMMPTPLQSAQENLNHENSLTPKIWRPGGSGGIKNPILRALARVGDVAGTALFPTITGQIPGTELHHKLAVQGAEHRVNQGILGEEHQAQTALSQAHATALLNPQLKTAFEAWQAQNPGVPVEKFFEAEQDARPDRNPSEFGEWRKQNPQAPLSQWFDLKNSAKADTAADADNKYRAIEEKLLQGQPTTPEEQAFVKAHEKLKTLGPVTSATLAQPGKNDARADRSYQFSSTQLEKAGQPIDTAMQRMGNLQESLKQGTPQADALIAPELLSIMAGGAGSGLRMNESEIARIVGARSNWESLKAAANKWKTDPNAANSITPAQRQQIHALVDAVHKKLTAKQAVLDDARQALINADDPHEHRKILTDARKQLDAIDAGTAQGGGNQPQRPANVPEGYVYQENGPRGKGWYKPQAK